MTTLNELYNELVKLSTEERMFLVLELMKADKISYQDITTAYTAWLEFKRKQISEDYQELKGRVLNEFVGHKKDRTKVLKNTIGYLVDKGQLNFTHEQIEKHK